MTIDDKTRTELEAAVFRRLVDHLRARTDVQNIDLMNLAGFCRNCLSNWMKEAADAKGVAVSKDESREAVYGMPYEAWKTKYPAHGYPGAVRGDEESSSAGIDSLIGFVARMERSAIRGSPSAGKFPGLRCAASGLRILFLSPVGALWMSVMLP